MDNAQTPAPAPGVLGQVEGVAIGAAEAAGEAALSGGTPVADAAAAAGVVIDSLAQAPAVQTALDALHARIAALEARSPLLAALAGVLQKRFPQDLAGLL